MPVPVDSTARANKFARFFQLTERSQEKLEQNNMANDKQTAGA
jgi:hypothetical protein